MMCAPLRATARHCQTPIRPNANTTSLLHNTFVWFKLGKQPSEATKPIISIPTRSRNRTKYICSLSSANLAETDPIQFDRDRRRPGQFCMSKGSSCDTAGGRDDRQQLCYDYYVLINRIIAVAWCNKQAIAIVQPACVPTRRKNNSIMDLWLMDGGSNRHRSIWEWGLRAVAFLCFLSFLFFFFHSLHFLNNCGLRWPLWAGRRDDGCAENECLLRCLRVSWSFDSHTLISSVKTDYSII